MRLLSAALLLCACTPSFASQSDVTDLRVLAIMADPAEPQFDASGVDTEELYVLAVDPAARDLATVTATLCAPEDAKRCSDPNRSLPLPTQTVRIGDQIKFSVKLPPDLIALAQEADKLLGLDGIQIMLSVSVDDKDPHGPVWASKTLIYSPRGKPPNHNPFMTGMQLSLEGQPMPPLNPGDTLRLTPGVQMGLRPILAPDAREEYDTTDLRGNVVHLKEDPVYSFFTSPSGDIDRDTVDEPLDGVAPPDGLTRIQTATSNSGTLYVVIRDGRGGESWLTFPWTTAKF